MTPADLRAWRLDHDLSQPELAWLLGVSVGLCRHWEAGTREIRPAYAMAIRSLSARQMRAAREQSQAMSSRQRRPAWGKAQPGSQAPG
jgi:predicted transcriptional regulator